MELTRTERLILETAAEMFDFEIGAAKAATMTEVDLSADERQRFNGSRPQLGELMVHRGWLDPEQLGLVLDRVYAEVQDWSNRLTSPVPVPVPRPPSEGSHGELAELVRQLTGLLDVLVGDGSHFAAALPAAPGPVAVERWEDEADEFTIAGAPEKY